MKLYKVCTVILVASLLAGCLENRVPKCNAKEVTDLLNKIEGKQLSQLPLSIQWKFEKITPPYNMKELKFNAIKNYRICEYYRDISFSNGEEVKGSRGLYGYFRVALLDEDYIDEYE